MSIKLNGGVASPGIGGHAARRTSNSLLRLLSALGTALQATCSFFGRSSQLAKTTNSGGTEPEHVFVIHP